MSVVHEELIREIEKLTEEQATVLLQLVRFMQPEERRTQQRGDWIDRARALRERIEVQHGTLPDVTQTLDEIWEERLNDLDSLR